MLLSFHLDIENLKTKFNNLENVDKVNNSNNRELLPAYRQQSNDNLKDINDTSVFSNSVETISTPWTNVGVLAAAKTSCDLQSDDNATDDRFTLVQKIKKRSKSRALPTPAKPVQLAVKNDKDSLAKPTKSEASATTNQLNIAKPTKIVGSMTTNPLFTASKSIIRKKIFYIGNVNLPDSSVIIKHCESRGIKLISCNPTTKPLGPDEVQINHTSFRLCVPAMNTTKSCPRQTGPVQLSYENGYLTETTPSLITFYPVLQQFQQKMIQTSPRAPQTTTLPIQKADYVNQMLIDPHKIALVNENLAVIKWEPQYGVDLDSEYDGFFTKYMDVINFNCPVICTKNRFRKNWMNINLYNSYMDKNKLYLNYLQNPTVSSIKFLGITLQSDLKWIEQVNLVLSKMKLLLDGLDGFTWLIKVGNSVLLDTLVGVRLRFLVMSEDRDDKK
ncbi:hypothetical protein HELRODRAFT_166109 [Helobdella robusta]|uniref:Uncharacterized protein n=1 Tax=Helobdella robusta TaxID=6412 RepID=T1EXS1_HELRO|nr:hypothetical protein HELRODRAFT_166109 [Helobdella robusta]ESN90443.1 hypothetical protein HELRODRAFT_166109 [Helobdella robusta]